MAAPPPADARRPVILAVDDELGAIGLLSSELERRYGRDYRIVYTTTALDAREQLVDLRADSTPVALVIADQWMPDLTGTELLAEVATLHPNARRMLLIEWGAWGDRQTAAAVQLGMAHGSFDYYVPKPWRSPDEFFHRMVCEFLEEWWRATGSAPRELTLVADARAARTHELRSLLARNGVPHQFHAHDSPEGEALLRNAGHAGATVPVILMLDGRVLVDPSNVEVARGYGVTTELDDDAEYDVVVVGGGPAGLAAAVYGSSEGFSTLLVERASIGGQAGSSSRIRNYLGFARGVSGSELAQRGYQQAWVFGTHFLLMQELVALRVDGDRHVLEVSDGHEITARAVVLAMGVSYRRLDVPALDRLAGAGVFYGSSPHEAPRFAGAHVFVVGGGNSAGQAAVNLARYAARVTLVVRGDSLAETMSDYLRDEIESLHTIDVRLGTVVVDGSGDSGLEQLTLRDRAGATQTVGAAALFVLIGAEPRTDWLPDAVARDEHGYVLTGPEVPRGDGGWSIEREPYAFETTVPGVFAVGDVRSRSVKRVAAAVGEGSVVIQDVHRLLGVPGQAHTS